MNDPTLAKIIRQRHPEWSWNQCRKVIQDGRVTVSGTLSRDPAARITSDLVVEIHDKLPHQDHHWHIDQQTLTQASSHNQNFEPLRHVHVYFHDQHVIVVEKPSGVESVPFETKHKDEGRRYDKASETMIDMARQWLEHLENRRLPPLKIVHRLDKGTSGVMVFARTITAERHLNQLFRRHNIRRNYVAICLGSPQTGTIRSQLVDNRGDGKRGSTRHRTLGKLAITHIQVIETRKQPSGTPLTMVRCTLETGRTHQIRIHLAESGHPICGETVYLRPRPHDDPIADRSKAPRIALHATDLGFVHPHSGEDMHWSSPLPTDLSSWWDQAII